MTDIVSTINVDKETSNSTNKQSLINEEKKQTKLHNFLIFENTPNSDSVCNDANKDC